MSKLLSKIRIIMAEKNISQKELYNYLIDKNYTIQQSSLSKMLNGKRKIPIEIFNAFADYFNISLDSLLERKVGAPYLSKIEHVSEPQNNYYTENELEYLQIIRELNITKDEIKEMAEHIRIKRRRPHFQLMYDALIKMNVSIRDTDGNISFKSEAKQEL